jgi:hypothetical protein
MNDKSVVKAHKLSLILSSLLLLLPVLSNGWSLRHAFVGQVLIALVFITGILLFATIRHEVNLLKRIYLWIYPAYPIILILAFFADRIMFVICMAPLWLLLNAPSTYVTNGEYSIKSGGGILGRPKAEVYRNYLVFNKRVGEAQIEWDPGSLVWKDLKVIDTAGSAKYVSLSIDGEPTYGEIID